MRKSWFLFAAWLLLLVPTLIIGGVALHLLKHEQERIGEASVSAVRERGRAVVGNLALAVTEVQEGVVETLSSLPRAKLAERLDAWRRENPLIRNVFVWQPGVGLVFPPPRSPGNVEEGAFIRRYRALFARQSAWGRPPSDSEASAPAPAADAFASRRELRQLTKAAPSVAAEADVAAGAQAEVAASGWVPWFWEDRLFLLGWVEPVAGGIRYGVELETMALLSRLVAQLPQTSAAEEIYALIDGSGRIVHQSGGPPVDDAAMPALSLSASIALPHWQLRIYPPEGGFSVAGGQSFLLLSSLMVAAVVAAILFGGSLLLWHAWRHQRDARRKTSFVSNVSHELKTPLTTIRMYADLMEEGKIVDETKRRRYLQVIVGESRRLARLVNNVLDFSRLEQGRKNYSREEIELKAFLNQLLDAQTMRLQQAGMGLEGRFVEKAVRVRADRDALEQVVLNLLDNAIKYAAGSSLEVELTTGDEQCRLRLLDRGPGVPAQHRKRIFEAFYRADDSLTTRRQGSGLGLSIARSIVRDLGGDLLYRTREGGGACFEVILPCRGENR